jgi:hypothetical protein
MNMYPWFLERMADYERDRIENDIKQIRLEEEAKHASRTEETSIRARLYQSHILRQVICALVKLSPLPVQTRKILRLSGNTRLCRG